MTNDNNRTLIIVLVGVAGLLVGCCFGALAGGAAVGLLGVRSIERSGFGPGPIEQVLPTLPRSPGDGATPAPDLQGRSGAFVRDVVPGSPADDAGIMPGDLIVRVDDTPLDANHGLAEILAQYAPGDRVRLLVQRDSGTETLRVTLAGSEDDPAKPWLGVWFMDVRGGD